MVDGIPFVVGAIFFKYERPFQVFRMAGISGMSRQPLLLLQQVHVPCICRSVLQVISISVMCRENLGICSICSGDIELFSTWPGLTLYVPLKPGQNYKHVENVICLILGLSKLCIKLVGQSMQNHNALGQQLSLACFGALNEQSRAWQGKVLTGLIQGGNNLPRAKIN